MRRVELFERIRKDHDMGLSKREISRKHRVHRRTVTQAPPARSPRSASARCGRRRSRSRPCAPTSGAANANWASGSRCSCLSTTPAGLRPSRLLPRRHRLPVGAGDRPHHRLEIGVLGGLPAHRLPTGEPGGTARRLGEGLFVPRRGLFRCCAWITFLPPCRRSSRAALGVSRTASSLFAPTTCSNQASPRPG